MNPPQAPPTRAEFKLPERTVIPADQLQAAQAMIQKQLDKWSFKELEEVPESVRILVKTSMEEALAEMSIGVAERYRGAGRLLGFSENFLELLELERQYHTRQAEWRSYQNWQKNTAQ